MTAPTDTMPITLNRTQREALRSEIRVAAGDLRDLGMALDNGERAFAVERIALLQQLAAALDAIGWTETEQEPGDIEVVVDRPLAVWARGQFQALSRSLSESTPFDMDGALTALGALHLIAEDLIADTDREGGE